MEIKEEVTIANAKASMVFDFIRNSDADTERKTELWKLAQEELNALATAAFNKGREYERSRK